MNESLIRSGTRQILKGLLGKEWNADPNYEDTPNRVARFYAEMFRKRDATLTTFEEEHHGQMVILSHHRDTTLCPHHLLPVFLDISLAYIPDKHVLGLSKLVRLVQAHFEEPILQEALTDSIVEELTTRVSPAGAVCLIYGTHTCMQIRGPKTTACAITTAVRGVFSDDVALRKTFYDLVRRP